MSPKDIFQIVFPEPPSSEEYRTQLLENSMYARMAAAVEENYLRSAAAGSVVPVADTTFWKKVIHRTELVEARQHMSIRVFRGADIWFFVGVQLAGAVAMVVLKYFFPGVSLAAVSFFSLLSLMALFGLLLFCEGLAESRMFTTLFSLAFTFTFGFMLPPFK